MGDSVELPLGLGSLDFIGLTEESTYEFSVGAGSVEWSDSKDKSHEVEFYYDDIEDSDIEIDGVSYYFEIDDDESDKLIVHDGDSDDDPIYIAAQVITDWTELKLEGNDDLDLNYLVRYNSNELHLALAADEYKFGEVAAGRWSFLGTGDINKSNVDGNLSADYFNAVSTDEDDDEVAVFKITDDGKYSYLFVDPNTEDLAVKDNYETTNYVSQGMYSLDSNALENVYWKLDQDDDEDDLAEGYTNWGTLVSVVDDKGIEVLPKDKLELQIFVGGGTSTETELNGATLTLTEEGMLVSNEDETVSAKLVSKSIDATGSGDAAIVSTEWNPANLVILDTQFSANPKVIVGGYLVNTLAEGIGLEDVITTSADYVVGKNATGNIVVAGMDAADTETAARELITAIEAM
jgi:hypothetical protein